MTITFNLRNNGTYNNNYVVWDQKNGGMVAFSGPIDAWGSEPVTIITTDAGFGEIKYSKNGNSPVGVPWIKNGDIDNV